MDNIGQLLKFVFASDVLKPAELKRLANHKYSASDISILDELCMKRFWRWLVQFCPMWIAPNLITLSGLLINMTAVLSVAYFSLDGRHEAPRWTYLYCAVGLFVYQTLDAIDGIQARRTNSASPLGEMFDHGCDSLSQVFVSMELALAFRCGDYPGMMHYGCMMSAFVFYAAHWQTYCSGTMKFDRIDVTEAQFGIIFICLMSAIFGPAVWTSEIKLLGELRLVCMGVYTILCIRQLLMYLQVVFTGGVGKNGSTVAGTSVIFPIVPIMQALVPSFMLFYKSTTGDFERYIVLYLFTFGLVSSKICNRIIVAHMCRSELASWDTIFYGPLMLFLNQYFDNFLPELYVLIVCFIYCLCNLISYNCVICHQICNFMKIECFTIPDVTLDKSQIEPLK